MTETKTETNLKGGSCVLSVGNFDGVHSGHKKLIAQLRELSLRYSVPAVAWTFAEHPNNYFKPGSLRYITSLEERESLLLEAGADTVFRADFPEYKNMSAEDFVEKELCGKFDAAAVVCGHSFTFGANAEGTPEKLKELLNERGRICITVPPVCTADGTEINSTNIRALLEQGDVAKAAEMLGRNFSFTLPVIHGSAFGRLLGANTANQQLPQDRVVLKHGVYASVSYIGGKEYKSVTNIGIRPTVSEKGFGVLAETHILDYNNDIYGKLLKVSLCAMIRPEKRFSDTSELKSAIMNDIAARREMQ